jgi:anti-sigma B factor antagonist
MTPLACFRTDDFLTVRVTGGDVVRVTVAGELDAFTAPQLGAALKSATAGEVIVDLAGVTFLDSAGVHVLADAHRRVVTAGGRLRVLGCRRTVRRPLEISGLWALLGGGEPAVGGQAA